MVPDFDLYSCCGCCDEDCDGRHDSPCDGGCNDELEPGGATSAWEHHHG